MSALHARFTIAAAGLLAAGIVAAACSLLVDVGHVILIIRGFVVTPQLWGEMKPVVSVKELMRDMLDPIADNIFDAIAIIVDKKRHGRAQSEDRRGLGDRADRRRHDGRGRLPAEAPQQTVGAAGR